MSQVLQVQDWSIKFYFKHNYTSQTRVHRQARLHGQA